MRVYVYALFDPTSLCIRYVGSTSNVKERLLRHLAGATTKEPSVREKSSKAKWIRSLLRDGMKPGVVVLERTDEERREDREYYWWAILQNAGCDLTNRPFHAGKLRELIQAEMRGEQP